MANITKRLNDLTTVMEAIKSDIKTFNLAVTEDIDALQARNAPVPDILMGLFDAYKSVGDTKFVEYMGRRRLRGQLGPSQCRR